MTYEVGLGIGLFLCCVSLFLILKQINFSKNKVETLGKVIFIRHEDPVYKDESAIFSPIVEFNDSEGNIVQFECTGSAFKFGLTEGKTVKILYDVNNPKSALIKSWWRRWVVLIVCLFFGLSFIYLSFTHYT